MTLLVGIVRKIVPFLRRNQKEITGQTLMGLLVDMEGLLSGKGEEDLVASQSVNVHVFTHLIKMSHGESLFP